MAAPAGVRSSGGLSASVAAAASVTDQSDVPALLQLVRQVLQKSYSCSRWGDGDVGCAQLDASVGATALCLMGHKQPTAKVAGYLFYEWLVRGGPDRLAARDAVGMLGVNALRKDAAHASPAVRASVVRAAAAALTASSAVIAASRPRGSDSTRSPDASEIAAAAREVLTAAAADASAFVRRAVAATAPSALGDEHCFSSSSITAKASSSSITARLYALINDSDPLVAVGALSSASTLRAVASRDPDVGSNTRGELSDADGIALDRRMRLLDGIASGIYPEFVRVAALKLACDHHRIPHGNIAGSRIVGNVEADEDLLYDLLDRLDPLLQAQDPCLVMAAIEAFAAYASRLPADGAAARDAAARLADSCLRLVAHPESTVVASVLGWLGDRSDLDRLAPHLCRGGGEGSSGRGGGLSLFYCRPSDSTALRRRKADILCRLAGQSRDAVADVAAHLLSQLVPAAVGSSRAAGRSSTSSAATAAAAAVARLGRLDDACRAACVEALERHVHSCDATALAVTASCWPTLASLAEPPDMQLGGRLLQATAASVGQPVILAAASADETAAAVAAAVRLASDCCAASATSHRDAAAVIAAATEQAFPEERRSANTAAAAEPLMPIVTSSASGTAAAAAAAVPAAGGAGLQLAVLASAVRCYYRRPCAISRSVMGRVLQAAVSCDCAIVREQAALYYALMQADTDCCRQLVLGAAQQQQHNSEPRSTDAELASSAGQT